MELPEGRKSTKHESDSEVRLTPITLVGVTVQVKNERRC